ncbi:MAG: hypothetical protein EZS28_043494 [Streblomastix strix]|uniref:Uncharacterized protein n=1 Tax=Streblomastix strix TaxID=222440 RepID=A0A5J4TSL9_9EUKA|nr:MAG: hypothetical protein EZS28_043494 [Streblomastix strix]
MSACVNAIKYALAYWDFKLDQDQTPKDDYAPEEIEIQATTSRNQIVRSTEKIFLSTGCHICKARFTSKNPPTLDRINNDRGHSADNVKP